MANQCWPQLRDLDCANHFTEENTELMLAWGCFHGQGEMSQTAVVYCCMLGTVTGRKKNTEKWKQSWKMWTFAHSCNGVFVATEWRETELCSELSCSFKLRKAFYFA